MSEDVSLGELRKASQGWIGKAKFGVNNNDLADELAEIDNLINRGINSYTNGNYPDSVASLGKAKSRLKKLEGKDLWSEDLDYRRYIYEGGNGSAYESGFYRDIRADNAVQAIDQLMDMIYEESETLSRR